MSIDFNFDFFLMKTLYKIIHACYDEKNRNSRTL